MSDPSELLERNRAWATRTNAERPGFLDNLAKGQSPHFLWIGCADSRVSAEVIAGLDPGEMFVHRNVANVVSHSDPNTLTVLDYAVSVLRVEHVIVCGHYGCGGVAAALDGQEHGRIDGWLRHIKDVAAKHAPELDALPPEQRANRLAELNAVEQALNVCSTDIVQAAWARGQMLTVRAWIYRLSDGLLRDLGVVIAGAEDLAHRRPS